MSLVRKNSRETDIPERLRADGMEHLSAQRHR